MPTAFSPPLSQFSKDLKVVKYKKIYEGPSCFVNNLSIKESAYISLFIDIAKINLVSLYLWFKLSVPGKSISSKHLKLTKNKQRF